jgi:hypothetical protein
VNEVARLYNLNFKKTIKPIVPNSIIGAKNELPKSKPKRFTQKFVVNSTYRAFTKIFTRKNAGTSI